MGGWKILFITDSGMWRRVTKFALSWGVSEDFVSEAKRDFNILTDQYTEVRKTVGSKYAPKVLDNSLSMQNFYPWIERFICFFILIFSGFRHTSLRELRFLLESSSRAHYIDTRYSTNNYKEKVKILKLFKPKNLLTKEDMKSLGILLNKNNYNKKRIKKPTFQETLKYLPIKEHHEISNFYNELCNYVHFSETIQTDALRDFDLNLVLAHPEYERDKDMLEKTFRYSKNLLLQTLEKSSI